MQRNLKSTGNFMGYLNNARNLAAARSPAVWSSTLLILSALLALL
jgi:hypothetical protein